MAILCCVAQKAASAAQLGTERTPATWTPVTAGRQQQQGRLLQYQEQHGCQQQQAYVCLLNPFLFINPPRTEDAHNSRLLIPHSPLPCSDCQKKTP
jgi:hypothetical protein